MNNLFPLGIASLTALALALPNLKAQSPQPQPAVAQSSTAQQDAIASWSVVKSPYYGTILDNFENKESIRQTNFDKK
ncbi:MAG: hypothetical protein O9350_06990 [Microcystis sp. LE19-388.1G]|jgi:hypothetical protein|nr:hypothetical protein [Microcystis sp. LE19-388.1G]